MTTSRVTGAREVAINGKLYRLAADPQRQLVSLFANKVTIGDQSKDTEQIASTWIISDARGGLGIDDMDPTSDVDRYWWSTMNTRYKGHLVLGPLATKTATPNAAAGETLGAMGELGGELYAVWGVDVFKYASTDTWGSSVRTLVAKPTDILTARLGTGGTTLLIAQGTAIDYSTNGSSWSRDAQDAQFLAFWDGRLWAIDSTGQLDFLPRSTAMGGAWETDAALPLPNDYVTDLFVAQDAMGEPILYAMTSTGLFAHDAANVRWVETQFSIPFHPNAGDGTVKWRNGIYIPVGGAIYRYQIGSGGATTSPVGPDRDHGLPEDKRGDIALLLGTHNDLTALVNAAASIPNEVTLHDCDTPWEQLGTVANVTQSNDTSVKQEGAASLDLVLASGLGAGVIVASEAITEVDLTDYGYLVAHVRSSVETASGDLQILIDSEADLATPIETLNVPILAVDTWKEFAVALAASSSLTNVISIGLKHTNEIHAATVNLDDVRVYRNFNIDTMSAGDSSAVFDLTNSGFSEILEWNEQAWQSRWIGTGSGLPLKAAVVARAYGKYRLWWSYDDEVYYSDLETGLGNPSQVPTYSYQQTGEHLTPWFNAGWDNLDKVALRVNAETKDATTTETVGISYATNHVESYTSLGTISSDTPVEYKLVNSDNQPVGEAFKSIRFKVESSRGTTTTNSPDLLYLTLSYYRDLPTKWGWSIVVDTKEDYGGQTPVEQEAALKTAMETAVLVEFTYRDDQSSGDPSNYYVKGQGFIATERTGYNFEGTTQLQVVEI